MDGMQLYTREKKGIAQPLVSITRNSLWETTAINRRPFVIQGQIQGRATFLNILSIRQVHPIAFQMLMSPRCNVRMEGRRFIGVLGSPNREHGTLSFQSTTSRNDELVDLSPTNSPSSRGFSSNKVLHQASEKLLKTQNLAKRHQSAYAERVSTFQVLPVDLGVLEARMKGTMLTLYIYRSRTTTNSDPKPISSNNLPQALHRFQVQAIPHSLRSTHIPRMLVR